MPVIQNAFYMIDEKFFTDFPDPYLKNNKESNRPHFYCFQSHDSGIFWVIPLSSQYEKYRLLMERWKSQNKPCDKLHIIEIAGKNSVFLIQDMFPITEEYFLREYTIDDVHLILKDTKDIREIEKKAKTILALIRRGVVLNPTQPNVLDIEKKLIKNHVNNVEL